MTRALITQMLESLEHFDDVDKMETAITAAKEYLAQPEQSEPVSIEPLAWMWQHEETGRVGFIDIPQLEAGWAEANPRLKCIAPVYLHPALPQPTELSDEEIWKFWWNKPEVPEGEDDSMETEFVAAVRAVLAAARKS